MSTVIRRKRASRRDLGPYKIHELLTGECVYPLPQYYTGYGDGRNKDAGAFISDEMRLDWEIHRDALMEYWRGERKLTFPWLFISQRRGKPWAARQFDRTKRKVAP